MTKTTYTEMVDSGIEWIGKIPKGREIQKIGHQFFMMGGFSFKSEDYVDEGIPVIKMSEIDNGNIDVSNANFVAENDEYKSFLLKKGDLVIGLSGSLNNFAMIKESNEPCYLNQRVGRVTSKIGNTRFLFYIIQSKAYIDQIYLTATGTAQLNISNKQVCDMKYSFPPLTTQQAIASYLDDKTAQIEQAIALKTQQIELMKEKRSALINHVVTKGLDPDVELVDSGIEWIGKIPKGWEVRKLKYVSNKIIDGAHFTPTYVEKGVPFLRVTDIQSDSINLEDVKFIPEIEHFDLSKRCSPSKGDLLLSKNGSIGITKVVNRDWEFSIFVSLCLIKMVLLIKDT